MLKQTTAILAALLISGVNLKSAAALAGVESIDTAAQSSIQIHLSSQKDSAIRLEVRQALLAKILKELAEKTGAIVHYSVLPEAPVTATCVGANVWQLMDCLVGKQVGLVANKPESGQPAEFWLLGSSVGSCQAMTIESTALPAEPVVETTPTKPAPPDKEYSDSLLAELRNAKTVDQRTEALGHLTMGADINDPNIRKVLDDAMTDKNPGIRVQALATLSFMDKDNATQIISHALQDGDRSVRIAAIEKAFDNTELLEQALADRDESVSSYAAAKLAQLKRNQERQAQH